jgi:capsular exopolysaccharide synthesis family protein
MTAGENPGLTPWGERRNLPARPAESVTSSFPHEEPGARVLLGFLRRRKTTILVAVGAVLLLAAAATLLWPETYTSTTTVLIERRRSPQDPAAPALAALERVGRAGVLDTEKDLIRSRRVVGPVVDSLDLHVTAQVDGREAPAARVLEGFSATAEAPAGTFRIERGGGNEFRVIHEETNTIVAHGQAGAPVTLQGLSFRMPDASVRDEITLHVESFQSATTGLIEGALEVSALQLEGDILRVDCHAPSPEEAQQVCASVVSEYVSLRSALQHADAGGTAAFLREQVARMGDSLVASENRLKEYKQEAQVVAIDAQANEEIRQYAQLKSQRDLVEAERSALSTILSRAERQGGGARRYRELATFPAFMGNQTMGFLMQELGQLETQRAELARRRTDENPELAALDQRIAQIDRQVGSIAREYARSLGAQVGSLDRALGGSQGRLSGYPERQVEAARLEREVASLTAVYNMLATRLREAEVAESVNEPSARPLDGASLPLNPSSPNKKMNMVLALVLGLGLGLALALMREIGDTRIYDRRALGRKTAIPVLAMVPTVRDPRPVLHVSPAPDAGDPVSRGEALPARRETRLVRPAPNGNGHGLDGDTALEVFRSLGADLQFVARHLPNGDLRSIAITSAGRGEGKTYAACNLAIARASFGVHTLLIDADMRRGGVARFFDLDTPSPGLSDLLSGRATARDARRTLRVNRGHVLSVMPSGEPRPDAAELLETAYFEAILSGAQAVYDLVIIDTPPLNVLADAAGVVASADAVLVVVREGMTDGEALDLTLQRLERAGGNVVGIVFNDVRLPRQFAYGRYTYDDR